MNPIADETPVEVLMQVSARDADTEEVDRLTRDLLDELRQLPLASIDLVTAGQVVRGAKSGSAAVLGALFAGVVPTFLPNLVAFLQSWLKRGDGKTIKIKAARGKQSFEVELPAGEFTHAELQELLKNLGGQRPAAKSEGL